MTQSQPVNRNHHLARKMTKMAGNTLPVSRSRLSSCKPEGHYIINHFRSALSERWNTSTLDIILSRDRKREGSTLSEPETIPLEASAGGSRVNRSFRKKDQYGAIGGAFSSRRQASATLSKKHSHHCGYHRSGSVTAPMRFLLLATFRLTCRPFVRGSLFRV